MFQTNQGVQALDPNQIIAAQRGDGVVSGLAVTVQSNLTLAYAAGEVIVDGETYAISSGTVTLAVADVTNPRKDVIYVNDEGEVTVVTGEPQALLPDDQQRFNTSSPSPASLNEVRCAVIAEIFVDAAQTVIASNDIRDRRLAPITIPTTGGTPFCISKGMTEWANGLSDAEIDRFVLTSTETLTIDRVELYDQGGGAEDTDFTVEILLDGTSQGSYNRNTSNRGLDLSLTDGVVTIVVTNGNSQYVTSNLLVIGQIS